MFKGSMVAIATPMNEDGSLDHESLEGLIEFHIKNNSDFTIVSNYINNVSKSGLLKINGILLWAIL